MDCRTGLHSKLSSQENIRPAGNVQSAANCLGSSAKTSSEPSMDLLRLEKKVAVVTGGARGIGRAICARYALEGAMVAVADLDFLAAKATAETLGENTFAVEVDVTRQHSIDEMVRRVVEVAGAIDILVNNAGFFDMGPLLEITPQSYDRVFAINVKGLLFTLQAVARQMIKQGRGGKIINLSSQAGRRGEALATVYCASKAAVISITQSAGLALIKEKINVNGIAPGVVDTPMWDKVDALFAKFEQRQIGEKKRLVGEAVPYGRMGTPDDLAGAAVFLASDDSDYVVAQTINVDGGNWMS
jgi:NAD(P)-dependent dehydrogenase (short-subunit alcohol dehydrogenase family)